MTKKKTSSNSNRVQFKLNELYNKMLHDFGLIDTMPSKLIGIAVLK